MKSSIIASGSEMLLEFVTSPAGPLLNTGFHFKADSIYDSGDAQSIQVNICDITFVDTYRTAPNVFDAL